MKIGTKHSLLGAGECALVSLKKRQAKLDMVSSLPFDILREKRILG